MSPASARARLEAAHQRGRMRQRGIAPAPLFAYGTLQFPAVLEGLIGRVPTMRPAAVRDWRAATMPPKVYPVLVAAPGTKARGHLLEDLTEQEWSILDAFENPIYDLHLVQTTTAELAWTFAGLCPPQVAGDWDMEAFARQHLTPYATHCAQLGQALRLEHRSA